MGMTTPFVVLTCPLRRALDSQRKAQDYVEGDSVPLPGPRDGEPGVGPPPLGPPPAGQPPLPPLRPRREARPGHDARRTHHDARQQRAGLPGHEGG